jgi:ribosomal protein L11 methylase PrmA
MLIFISFIFASLIFFLILAMFTGAPLVPTKSATIKKMLDLLDLKKNQVLYDLGCGDGRILIEAVKRGARGVGIDINPYVLLLAYIAVLLNGALGKVKLRLGNYWSMSISDADAVVVYAMPQITERLSQKFKEELKKGTLVASNTFELPHLKLIKQEKVGNDRVYLYRI